LAISIRQPSDDGRRPSSTSSAASSPATNRFERLASSAPSPSPVTVSASEPSPSTASTVTVFVRSRARPRQSYPAPRFADEAGTSTVMRRPAIGA
jgi:hypothetical protein